MENQTIRLNDEKVLIKRYKVRSVGTPRASIETTIPKEVFEREARCQGMTLEEALKTFMAVWRFNSFRGLHLSFEKKSQNV